MIPLHQFKPYLNLTWNPFLADVPINALFAEEQVLNFCWSVEQLVLDGGFALVTGDPGYGKSVVMRILDDRLNQMPELCVRKMSRPQSRIRDFYREMAALFGVEIQTSNRYGSFHKLREQWLAIIQKNLFRPVLLIDEAQEIPEEVLAEMRMLGSKDLDARCILAVVFAGDNRLLAKFQSPVALPLFSRIRVNLVLEPRNSEVMKNILQNALKNAGNPELMTPGVIHALAEQHLGNPRAMMITGNQLLTAALQKEIRQIDENLYFDVTRSHTKKRRT